MLAGEYAVLRGGHALAAALTCGMTIRVEWDPKAAVWEIHSSIWTEPKVLGDDHTPQTDMLCRAVQFAAKKTGMHGGRVFVKSDIEIKHGIGSSSALRLGICGAFFAIKNGPDSSRPGGISTEAIHAAWQLQCEGQGIASGYDIVAQYVGGLVEFSFEYGNNKWKPHWFRHNLEALNQIAHVFVGGRGAPTTQTVQTMASWLDGGNRNEKLMDTSETLVDAFNMTIQWPDMNNLKKLTSACAASRNIFAGSPHFPTNIASDLAAIEGLDRTWSWKTTGAGGEDAILLIGTESAIQPAAAKLWDAGWHRLDFRFSMTGCHIISRETDESTATTPGMSAHKSGATSGKREFLR